MKTNQFGESVLTGAEFNALSGDDLVHLQETNPELYQRSLAAARSTSETNAAEATTEATTWQGKPIIPASQWSTMTADDRAAVSTTDPELERRSAIHHQTCTSAGEVQLHDGKPILPASDWNALQPDQLMDLKMSDPDLHQRTMEFHATHAPTGEPDGPTGQNTIAAIGGFS